MEFEFNRSTNSSRIISVVGMNRALSNYAVLWVSPYKVYASAYPAAFALHRWSVAGLWNRKPQRATGLIKPAIDRHYP